MRPVSTAFLDAIVRSYTLATRCDLLFDGQRQPIGIDLQAGSVTLDRTAEIRGRCDVTIDATGTVAGTTEPVNLIATGAFDPLTPFGAELQLWRGVALSTGDELVSLGIFGIQTTKTEGGTIQVTGLDRAQRLKDADFEGTYVIPAGTNVGDAIRALFDFHVPGLEYRFASVDAVTPLLVYGDDTSGGPWAAGQALATSVGYDTFFDGDGRCAFEPVPDPNSDPVATLTDGERGTVVTAGKTWDRGPAFNAVIAVSSNPSDTGPPARAVVHDDDPTSPTYYGGPFGRKPKRYSSPLITTAGQAFSAADGLLRASRGIAQGLDVSAVPQPHLEPGDIVHVVNRAARIDEVNVLDSITIPLDESSAMTCGVRARQVA